MAQRKVSEAIAGVGNADNAFAQLNRFEQSVAKEEACTLLINRERTGTDLLQSLDLHLKWPFDIRADQAPLQGFYGAT